MNEGDDENTQRVAEMPDFGVAVDFDDLGEEEREVRRMSFLRGINI